MTNEELRDGLAKVLACCEWDNVGEREISVMRPVADAALAYLHQHNDFARRVREVAAHGARPGGHFPLSTLDEIVKLCDEELGDGQQSD